MSRVVLIAIAVFSCSCSRRAAPTRDTSSQEHPSPLDVGCFAAGTLVATPSGSVPIERIRVGDAVLSYNHRRRQVEDARVAATWGVLDKSTIAMRVGETTIHVTGSHPLYDPVWQSYRSAADFKLRDTVLVLSKEQLASQPISRLAMDARRTVYNLTVMPNENFFANGLLVHNKSVDTSQGSCLIHCDNCRCSTRCQYAEYTMTCTDTDCRCTTDGLKVVSGSCKDKAAAIAAFTGECGYPGSAEEPLDGGFPRVDAQTSCTPICGGFGGPSCNCKMLCVGRAFFIQCDNGLCKCTENSLVGTAPLASCEKTALELAAKKACKVIP